MTADYINKLATDEVTNKLSVSSQNFAPTDNSSVTEAAVKIPDRQSSSCRRPVAIDLFAGAGGFSLGIEQAGFDLLVAVEIDPVHAAVYKFNSPHTKVLCTDITQLSFQQIQKAAKKGWAAHHKRRKNPDEISDWDGEIDLIIGGPPCQGFSIMGHRHFNDDRNDLIFHFCRLVKELQPRYFVMENVPGISQGKHRIYLHQLIDDFQTAGYQITDPVKILNAADFGVPQDRRRLFLLGARAGEPLLFYPQSPINYQSPTVRDAIADIPNLDDFPALKHSDSVRLSSKQIKQQEASASFYARQMLGIATDSDNFAYPRSWNQKLLTSSMQTQHTVTSIQRFQTTLTGQLESISHLRRLDWNSTCHTLRAGTGSGRGRYTSPRPIHPEYPRVISVREAARLHSFPDWFRFHTTKWHGFREVGNAVPPLLAKAVGSQVIAALGIVPSVPILSLKLGSKQLLTFNHSEALRYWQKKS